MKIKYNEIRKYVNDGVEFLDLLNVVILYKCVVFVGMYFLLELDNDS